MPVMNPTFTLRTFHNDGQYPGIFQNSFHAAEAIDGGPGNFQVSFPFGCVDHVADCTFYLNQFC